MVYSQLGMFPHQSRTRYHCVTAPQYLVMAELEASDTRLRHYFHQKVTDILSAYMNADDEE